MRIFINSILMLFLLLSCQDNRVKLVDKEVCGGKLKILLPEDFLLMSNEMLQIKYPNVNSRPTEVYTNAGGTINAAFNLMENEIIPEQLAALKETMGRQFENMPGITLNSAELKSINGKDYVVLDFYSDAIDTKVYNVIFAKSVENKIMMGTFNCTMEHYRRWKSTGNKIVSSVRMLE